MLLDSGEFVPAGARERLAAPLLRLAVRIALKSVLSPNVPIRRQRWWLRLVMRSVRPGTRVDIRSGVVGGVSGEWARSRLATASAAAKGVILYLHGGAYCVGSPAAQRSITSRLARAADLPLFAADYRLAPENPFPAAVDDALSVYRSLVETGPVVIAGHSAGGGLALAIALAIGRRHIKPPVALVVFSPWTDLTTPAIGGKAPKGEAMLSALWLNSCARHYLAGSDAMAPLASPIYGDLRGLPPTLIQTGTDDLLRNEAARLHDALFAAGVAVRCEIVPARWHAFQLHAGVLPSATEAIRRAGSFIVRHIPV